MIQLTPSHRASDIAPAVLNQDLPLVEMLLDANRVSSGWQDFLDGFRLHFNLHSCHIYIASNTDMSPRFQDFSGPRPSDWQMREYTEKYFHTDYTHLAIINGDPGDWYASNLMENREQIEAAAVFKDWSIPNGITFVAGACLFRQLNSICVLVHNRGPQHGEYSQQEVERFASLTPYLVKALELRVQLAEGTKDRLRIKSVLNKFRIPVATLNEFGEVIAQNDLMQQLAEKHGRLHIEADKHLLLADDLQNKQLQMGVAERIANAKGKSLSYSTDVIDVPASDDVPAYKLGIEEMTETDEENGDLFIGATVYAISPEMIVAPSAEQLSNLFRLTKAEASCCHLFMRGLSLKEIALHENKSVNTVREQIQNCYRKTSTKGQLEMINLLASLPAG